MSTGNPFTPGFGGHPPFLAGRSEPISEIIEALDSGPPTRKEYATVLLGARGAGKTTLLGSIIEQAQKKGWRAIEIDTPYASSEEHGVLADLYEQACEHLEDMFPPSKRKFTGFTIPLVGGGFRWESRGAHRVTLKKLLRDLVQSTKKAGGAGVLLAFDEFHNMTPSDASQVAGAIQQISKNRQQPLAFIGAALPHVEHTLLREEGFTFFHRAHRRRVEHLNIPQSMRAISKPLREAGYNISDSRLRVAAEATRGLPYAIQSVGYYLWEKSSPVPAEVTDTNVSEAIALMRTDVNTFVASPIWNRLSAMDKLFLRAMLIDSGPSTLTDIVKRLGNRLSNPSTYKQRLLKQGAIIEVERDIYFASEAIRDRAAEEQDLAEIENARDMPGRSISLGTSTLATYSLQVCDAWMPRAKTRCVLNKGHRGHHRKTKT